MLFGAGFSYPSLLGGFELFLLFFFAAETARRENRVIDVRAYEEEVLTNLADNAISCNRQTR